MASSRCDRCGGKGTRRYEQYGVGFVLCDTHVEKHGPRLLELGWFAYRLVDVDVQPA